MDESFAVGDRGFWRKCLSLVAEYKVQKMTMVFVGCGLESQGEICERTIWLEHGRVLADGPFAEVLGRYLSAVL
jgi:ABC-type polysaccharide/polyol phosphate transport system ATPase subunit